MPSPRVDRAAGRPGVPVRPRDAAGLLLIRDDRRGPQVLMGRRHRRSRFMPNVYVFPGGQLERQDCRDSGFREALPPQPPGLDGRTAGRLEVYARAALRETFEESGLLVGRRVRGRRTALARPKVWDAYAAAGVVPAFDSLVLCARAITPTASPIRFHTRFFLATGATVHGSFAGDGELEDLRWVALEDIASLPMSGVTTLVLDEALAHLAERRGGRAADSRRAALFRWVGPTMQPRHRAGRPAGLRQPRA